MAALAVEHDPVRLASALHRTLAALRCYLNGLGSQGGCAEGVGYWAYGFGYFTYFTEALRERIRQPSPSRLRARIGDMAGTRDHRDAALLLGRLAAHRRPPRHHHPRGRPGHRVPTAPALPPHSCEVGGIPVHGELIRAHCFRPGPGIACLPAATSSGA